MKTQTPDAQHSCPVCHMITVIMGDFSERIFQYNVYEYDFGQTHNNKSLALKLVTKAAYFEGTICLVKML